jgi:hypothetical protein
VNVHGIRHRPASDRGEAIVGYVVLVPVVLLVLLLGIQAAVYFHAANIASHAGARSVAVASRRGSGSAQGVLEAQSVIAESGSVPLSVRVIETDTVRAEITVRVDRVVPFFPDRVTRIVSAPKERYLTEDQR